jgi:hypothetical protein
VSGAATPSRRRDGGPGVLGAQATGHAWRLRRGGAARSRPPTASRCRSHRRSFVSAMVVRGRGRNRTAGKVASAVLYDIDVSTAAPDITAVAVQLDAAEEDARALVAGLCEALGTWREAPGTWSVAECLDHLATANRVYLEAMRPPAEAARARGRVRRGPARPGIVGRLFIRSLEPPVSRRFKARAPQIIRPRPSPPLAEAFAAFTASQEEVRIYLRSCADLDLARIRFPNPLVRGIRFSLATGLHVIAAHERRHLWQAWRVRRAA